MELADFPHLKELVFGGTVITGDISDIGIDDFPSIETKFILPYTVEGGYIYKFQRIRDVPKFMQAILPLLKHEHIFDWYFSELGPICNLHWRLSIESPDYYSHSGAPFYISIVRVGSRLGWRWENRNGFGYEINWLDPEPSRESNTYDIYINELQKLERRRRTQLECFRGYYQPPTEEEYIGIYNELLLSDQR